MIVDSSVMSAWCIAEPRGQEAHGLILSGPIIAPRLVAYELTNVARKKTLRHPEKAELVRNGLEDALGLPIDWRDVDRGVVIALALGARLSANDASYLWLARATGLALASFDDDLMPAAKAAGRDGGR